MIKRMASAPVRCCKTCRFLAVPEDSRGHLVVRGNGTAYECTVIVPEPVLPDSITRSSSYRARDRMFMEGSSGTKCPAWEPRAQK